MIKLDINIKPIGKGRPRVTRYGTYTPEKTKQFQNDIGWEFKRSYPSFKPSEKALRMVILAQFKVPKSYTKKKTKETLERKFHTKKPDGDNIAKAIKDSLNNLAYVDDSQVCELEIKKIYGETDRIVISIEELE